MRGRGGVELGSSPWELSTTAEVLVWRRKTKGKREKRGGVSRAQVWTSALRTTIYTNPKAQGLWKLQPQKCLSELLWVSLAP